MPKINVKNMHYHKIIGYQNNGLPIFAPPKRVGYTAVFGAKKTGDSEIYYADGEEHTKIDAGSGYTISLTLGEMSEDFGIECLGVKRDLNGTLMESENAIKSDFALTGEIDETIKGSSLNPFKFVYYKCSAGNPSESAETKRESTTFSETELEITSSSILINGKKESRGKQYKYTDVQNEVLNALYENFDKSVYIPEYGEVGVTTLTLTDPTNTDYIVNTAENTVTVTQTPTIVEDLKNFITADDTVDGDITSDVFVQGLVDTSATGTYPVIYIVQNSQMKYETLEVTFIVV